MSTRQVDKATVFYRISTKNANAVQEVAQDDAQQAIGNKEAYAPPQPDIDTSNLRMSVAKRMFDKDLVSTDDKELANTNNDETLDAVSPLAATSWRVSPDEFIIKVDASPLHMSAARRMFDKQDKVEEEQQTMPEQQEQHENEWKQFWNKITVTLTGKK
mmetsp:Transcript_1003/g.1805  ORF Transcript_1003/g.1805 Transcript_1003/m.1805 type:complete len:159 (-) Transcript_1003:95-571(-)